SVMNATSFQVPEGFVRSSPKHGEPWSRSPVASAAQIRILLLAGMVSLPLGCQCRCLSRPHTQMIRSFFQCVCELVHTCARALSRIPNDLYRVLKSMTLGRFPNGGESDSTRRTEEVRHVGSDTITPGF